MPRAKVLERPPALTPSVHADPIAAVLAKCPDELVRAWLARLLGATDAQVAAAKSTDQGEGRHATG